jgi:hypothetical protein
MFFVIRFLILLLNLNWEDKSKLIDSRCPICKAIAVPSTSVKLLENSLIKGNNSIYSVVKIFL